MTERGRDWRTILLAAAAVAGACLALIVAASMVFYVGLAPHGLSLRREAASPLDVLIPATAVAFMAVLALPTAYFSIRYLASGENPVSRPRLLRFWEVLVLLAPWIGASWLAGYLIGKQPWQWLTPPLYLLAVAIPVYLVVRVIAGGLSVGSARKSWGLFSTGMIAGPALAISVEIFLVLLVALGVGIYLAFNPSQMLGARELLWRLNHASNIDQTLTILDPLLRQPLVLVVALLFFSGLAPLIEESAKSIAVWTVFDRLGTPAQGFIAGALSGAGFGLMESLFASATPDPSWMATLLIRGGSSMMHIAAASITGWGIARFRASRHLTTLLAGYAGAMVLHSLWNAAVISIAFGSLQTVLTGVAGIGATALTLFGAALLGLLCLGMPIALAVVNARMRHAETMIANPPAATLPPAGPA